MKNRIINRFGLLAVSVIYALILSIYYRMEGVKGTDTPHYIDYFRRISGLNNIFEDFSSVGDYGFFAISSVIKLVTDESQLYLMILFFISSFILFLATQTKAFYAKFTTGVLFIYSISLTSSFILLNINGLRQGLAASIVVLALSVASSGFLFFGLILALVASTVHLSASFFLMSIIAAAVILKKWPVLKFSHTLILLIVGMSLALLISKFLMEIASYAGLDYISYKLDILSRATAGETSVKLKYIFSVGVFLFFMLWTYGMKIKNIDFIRVSYLLYIVFITLFLQYEMVLNRYLVYSGYFECLMFVLCSSYLFNNKYASMLTILVAGVSASLYGALIMHHPSVVFNLEG